MNQQRRERILEKVAGLSSRILGLLSEVGGKRVMQNILRGKGHFLQRPSPSIALGALNPIDAGKVHAHQLGRQAATTTAKVRELGSQGRLDDIEDLSTKARNLVAIGQDVKQRTSALIEKAAPWTTWRPTVAPPPVAPMNMTHAPSGVMPGW